MLLQPAKGEKIKSRSKLTPNSAPKPVILTKTFVRAVTQPILP